VSNTRKINQNVHRPLPFKGQKNLPPNSSFLTRHPDSSFESAKFIRFAPVVNRRF